MTAWDYAKTKGTTLKNISLATGQSLETLRNWHNNKNKKQVFKACVYWTKRGDHE